MTHSLCYRIYKRIENIYVNSKLVNCFSNLLSSIFHILVCSKIFAFFTNENSVVFKESFLFKGFYKAIQWIMRIFSNISCIQRILKESFVVNLFKDILEKGEKQAINSIYLIIALSLFFSSSIKIIAGSFSFAANKIFIVLFVLSVFLYVLRLDYGTILKESKIIRMADKIFNDEM